MKSTELLKSTPNKRGRLELDMLNVSWTSYIKEEMSCDYFGKKNKEKKNTMINGVAVL